MFHLSYLLKYFFNNLIKCQNIQLTAIRSFHPSFTPQDPPVFAYTTSIRYITVTASKLLWYYTFQNKILSTARKFSIFVCQDVLEIWDILVLNGVGIVPCCYLLAEV